MGTDLLQLRQHSDVVVVRFHAETLDESNSTQLAESLLEVFRARHTTTIHLDFTNVRSVARYVWLEINDLNLFLDDAGWRFCLLNLRPTLSQQLRSLEETEYSPSRGMGASDGAAGSNDPVLEGA